MAEFATEVLDLLRSGLGRALIPQFVKPRTTPPFWRMRLPALRAILRTQKSVGVWRLDSKDVLFDFRYKLNMPPLYGRISTTTYNVCYGD